MSADKSFKVVIVGGGIAGLSLAIMLEKFSIDYVLLEAHDDIAPPLGASIAMMPNGLLILDQLGCYEDIRSICQGDAIKTAYTRDVDGSVLSCTPDILEHLEIRHGYPMLFFDREWLLKLLYDHVQNKDRILVGQKVRDIITANDGVEVRTTTGVSYRGSVVVGADGVHSATRKEMVRLAHERAPGYFPVGEEDRVPCYYQCSFGIAQEVESWPDGDQCFTLGREKSFLVASGPMKRVYWFFFSKLPQTRHGQDIPSYTKQDEAAFVDEHRDVPITEKLTFGELFSKRISSALTPLHEVVYQKWYFERILVIGDAVHKPNPIGGMGGNGAIESAAEFVNALIDRRRTSALETLTTQDLAAIGKQVQDCRHERAKFINAISHDMQALFAFENPMLSNLVWYGITPLTGEELALELMVDRIVGASRLRYVPIPNRPRRIPYDHELPARPWKSFASRLPQVLLLAAGVALFYLPKTVTTTHLGDLSKLATTVQSLPRILTSTLFPSILNAPDQASDGISIRSTAIYQLSQLLSPALILTVEGYRAGNRMTPLAVPARPVGRNIRPEVAESLVPAISLAYLLPTSLILAGADLDADAPALKFAYDYVFVLQAIAHAVAMYAYMRRGNAVAFTDFSSLPQILASNISSWSGVASTLSNLFNRDGVWSAAVIATSNLYTIWDLRRLGYTSTSSAIKTTLKVALGQVLVGPSATWALLWRWREQTLLRLSVPA
ncbi:unnamed protein product [Parascedosporium putredinis]|uniref:FAD-binding domain-containing protein n=1 Tax=Parascedosporium putredinis TaxID=1442378 RepID=A0A9P1GY09_9PEZI|nr:unnamed protein product [Parascedosporium putredinis]CAI7989683.1 unnamed protein product [Parascedosporium putredinis]